VLLSGFVVAHLYSVLAYFRGGDGRPALLLKFWRISSFGGFAGDSSALALFRFKARDSTPTTRLRTWTPSRTSSVRVGDRAHRLHGRPRPPRDGHDLPAGDPPGLPGAQAYIASFLPGAGRLAELPPPAALARMAFHDLGWYEFLYTSCLMVPPSLPLDRKPQPAGILPDRLPAPLRPGPLLPGFPADRRCQYLGLTPGSTRDRGFPRRGLLHGANWPTEETA